MTIPSALSDALAPLTIVCGHYGVGKTNFSCNLIMDLACAGRAVTAVDLDIVNPYFRTTEQRALLEEAGARLISPRFAEVGTSLDVPSLPGSIDPAFEAATPERPVIVDAGGDDVGATALGRFAATACARGYAMLGVLNKFRNLVADPHDAFDNLREIESASRLKITALVSNAHLKEATDATAILEGYEYAREVAALAGLPLVAVSVPDWLDMSAVSELATEMVYPVHQYVKTPWEVSRDRKEARQ